MAMASGAEFILSPDMNPIMIGYTRRVGAVAIPGCMTPSEIVGAENSGADMVNIFPAGILGAGYINAVRQSVNHVRMLASGGVSLQNAADFLTTGCVGVCMGDSLSDPDMIIHGKYGQLPTH